MDQSRSVVIRLILQYPVEFARHRKSLYFAQRKVQMLPKAESRSPQDICRIVLLTRKISVP